MEIGNVNGIQNFSNVDNKKTYKAAAKPNIIQEITVEQPKKQMVNAQMFLATIPNCSFKGSVSEPQEMSDEEFAQKKKEIEEKITIMPIEFQGVLKCLRLNRNNIQLAKNIISDEVYCKNEQLMYDAVKMINETTKKEQYNLAAEILDKHFYNNMIVAANASKLMEVAKNKNQIKLAEKIFFNEELRTSLSIMADGNNVIKSVSSEEEIEESNKLLAMMNMPILDPKMADRQFHLANYILDNFSRNSRVLEKAELISSVETDEQVDFTKNFLSKFSDNDKFIQKAGLIIRAAQTEKHIELINKILLNDEYFQDLYNISNNLKTCSKNRIDQYIKALDDNELTKKQIVTLLSTQEINYKDIIKLNKTIGNEKAGSLSKEDTIIASKFVDTYKKENINEIQREGKKKLLKALVASDKGLFNISDDMKQMFPIIPTNQEDYCKLLPSVVRSLGFDTNVILDKHFDEKLNHLGETFSDISDENFKNLDINQEYSKDEFITDVLDKVKDLPRQERQKVYDYFGFELHHNKKAKTGYSITGYPMNLNNGEKLAQIENPQTREVVENIRKNVIKFTKDNKITCSNKELETDLNNIIKLLPELRATIGCKQHGTHDYDVFQHSLKVMQGIVKNPDFNKLEPSDKKIMLLASLLHDITKKEGVPDRHHSDNSAFDSSFIIKKFNLSQEEQIKLFTLIKNHEWNNYVNSAGSEDERIKRQQSVAYDLRHDNLFELSLMFTHADLQAVNDNFADTKEGKGRTDFEGVTRSFSEACDFHAEKIRQYIEELKSSQPLLPVTKLPNSSTIETAITEVNEDGSTNIKGVYKDKDGLIVIKYNELENEDLEKIGFPKGSITKGIEAKTSAGDDVDTGNIKFFAHGLDFPNQLAKFDAFNLINSDVLLSVSYAERPESKYRFFRSQGILLDVDTKYIHGGGETDSGSGYGKFISEFKKNYIFGAYREGDRKYISDLIKTTLNMNDEEYKEFVKKYENASLSEIEPKETREKLIKAFSEINSNVRMGKREYNEMYISNPKPPMAVFAYPEDYNGKIDNPIEFLQRTERQNHESKPVKERTEFLRQYALEHNIPFIVFGN